MVIFFSPQVRDGASGEVRPDLIDAEVTIVYVGTSTPVEPLLEYPSGATIPDARLTVSSRFLLVSFSTPDGVDEVEVLAPDGSRTYLDSSEGARKAAKNAETSAAASAEAAQAAAQAAQEAADGIGGGATDEGVASFIADPGSASATAVGAAAAAAAANPETALNSAILEVAQSVTPGGVYYPFHIDDINAARPVPPVIAVGQKVAWYYQAATMLPLPTNREAGDQVYWVEEEPLPWSPSDLPGLVGWWDAAATPGVTDGAAVSTWDNLVAGQPDATIYSGGTAPTFDVDALAAHPALVFAEGGALVASGFANLPLPYTIYLYGAINAAASDRALEGRNSSGTSILQLRNGSGNWVLYKGSTAVVTGPPVNSSPHLFVMKWAAQDGSNPTAVSLELDESGTPSTGSGAGNLALSALSIGGQAGGLTVPISGPIGLVLLVAGTVSAQDHDRILGYLDDTYGTSYGD